MDYKQYKYHGIFYYGQNKTFFCFLFIITMFSSYASSSQKIPKEELINLIHGLEKNYNVLEYKMMFKRYTIPENDVEVDFAKSISYLLNETEPAKIKKKTHCLTEPTTGRIYVKREGTTIMQEKGSSSTYYGQMCHEKGFDGQIRTQLDGFPSKRQTAIVEKEPLRINKELSSFEMGMDMLLPCYRGVGLSQYLLSDDVESSSVQGVLQEDGTLEVTFLKSDKQKFRLIIDIEKGGAILSEEYFVTGDEDTVIVKMEYTWEKNDSGYWVPRKGVGASGTYHPTVYSWSFDTVQVNHVKPTIDKYRITFPFGTKVEDRVVGLHYVVGKLPQDVILDVRKTLMEAPKMNSTIAKKIGSDLILSKNEVLTPESTAKEKAVSNVNDVAGVILNKNGLSRSVETYHVNLWGLSALGFIIFATVILVYVLSKKNKSTNLILILFITVTVLIVKQDSFAKMSSGVTTRDYDGWTIRGPGEKRTPVYQCGFNSTVFVLEYFHLTYKSKQLMNLMTPSVQGISLSDIARTLQMHGLEVKSMKGVSAADLNAHITEKRIALLPTDSSGGKGHYYIIVPGNKTDFLLVDAGISVTNCSKDKIKNMLKQNDGIVAFIMADKNKNDSSKINISTTKYDLGKFAYSSQKEIVAKFVLENTSTEEVLLKNISTSCSCMAIKCIGSTIKEKEKFNAKVLILPSSWGVGNKTKHVLFVFGDGSSKKVQIEGECIDEQGIHDIKMSPQSLYIDINNDAEDGVIRRKVMVFTKEEAVNVSSEEEWLHAKLLDKDENNFRTIEVEIHVDKIKEQQIVTRLNIWSKENLPKIKFPIHISAPKRFIIKPRVRNIALGNEGLVSFSVTSLFENNKKIKIVGASADLSDILLDWVNTTERGSRLDVSVKQKDIPLGLHPIELEISLDGNIYTERVYLLIQ